MFSKAVTHKTIHQLHFVFFEPQELPVNDETSGARTVKQQQLTIINKYTTAEIWLKCLFDGNLIRETPSELINVEITITNKRLLFYYLGFATVRGVRVDFFSYGQKQVLAP